MNEFKIKVIKGDVSTIRIEGSLDAHTCAQLGETLLPLIQDGFVRQVWDLKNLDYISSAGLNTFQTLREKTKNAGGDIKFLALPDKIYNFLELTGVNTMLQDLEKFDDEEKAKMSFGESPPDKKPDIQLTKEEEDLLESIMKDDSAESSEPAPAAPEPPSPDAIPPGISGTIEEPVTTPPSVPSPSKETSLPPPITAPEIKPEPVTAPPSVPSPSKETPLPPPITAPEIKPEPVMAPTPVTSSAPPPSPEPAAPVPESRPGVSKPRAGSNKSFTQCPGCEAVYHVSDETPGETVKCMKCDAQFLIPFVFHIKKEDLLSDADKKRIVDIIVDESVEKIKKSLYDKIMQSL